MMRVLVDTHVALWALSDSAKLPVSAREILQRREHTVYFSLASVWEVAIKHAINEENMPMPEERFVELCERTGFLMLPIKPEHIYAVKGLRRCEGAKRHSDPFDRLLVAQAKTEGLTFLTHDAQLSSYDEPCILPC